MKERLIGAAVLVALGVWLIPWVLNGPEETHETQATSLELPSPDEPLPVKSQTLDLRSNDVAAEAPGVEESEASGVGPAGSGAAPSPAPALAAAAVPKVLAESGSAREADAPPSSDSAPTAPAGNTNGAAFVAKAPAAAPASKTPVAAAPASQRTPPADSKSRPAPAVVGGWAVQLGSFGEEENARRLASRVKTYGYKADVSNYRAGGRSMYRVRVGPMAARGDADAAASALSAHGFVARVVAVD